MTETRSYYKKIASITVENGGSGYTSAPTVVLSGNGSAVATVSDGKVTSITVTNPGNNYIAPPTIEFVNGGGSGATATATMIYVDDEYNGFTQSLSYLIANQLPDFVRQEYPIFVTFLEKYYEFLDQDGQVNNFLLNYEKNFDVNRTLDIFLPKFKNQYAQNFPLSAQLDDRRLIKFIKQFYEAKGSEKAIELLFRILYNERTEFFYPSEHVLRASDGIWIEDVTLKLATDNAITANPFDLSGKTVKIIYHENVGSVTFERTVETNITNVTKFAYVYPPVYELATSLPKAATILVPGAGGDATALVSDGQVKAIVGEGYQTFNAASGVNVTTNAITITSHGYNTGDVVVYFANGGTAVTGLTNYSVYYVIVVNSNTIKLATSATNAASGTAIDLTVVGSGTQKLYEPLISTGNGYYAAPIVQFTSTTGSGAAGRAVIKEDGTLSHVIMVNGGSDYSSVPAITFSTEPLRTRVEITVDDTTTVYGYIIRQLSTVEVISCDGTPPCGFSVGDIFSIDETGSIGPYTIDYENDSQEYFLNKNNQTDVVINPYTLVGRDNRARIKIESVDQDGCPTSVSIFDTGFDFEREEFTATIESPLGCTATLSFNTGAVNVKEGRFKDSRGMLSDVNKLQDNYYYQNYSYVVRSNVPSNKWIDVVKKTAHPAGTMIFGELTIEQTVDFSPYITTPVQPLHIYEFVLEELSAETFYYAVDFIKVLADSAEVSDSNANHVYKVLSDSVSAIDEVALDFTVGIYQDEGDILSPTDVFERVVQYVRDVSENTITADDAITDFSKVLEETLYLQSPYAPDYFEETYVSADSSTFDFAKVLSDAASATENLGFDLSRSSTDTATATESFARTVQYYRSFAESVITHEYSSAGIERPLGNSEEVDADDANANDNSFNHLYKYLTDSVTSTDTTGIIPYLVKTDTAGATELLIVANDTETIESIAATEQSLINVLKGIFETVAVEEDGIINLQDYIEGDFGSDYVGQSMTFSGANSTFPVPGSILNLDANNSESYSGSGSTWYDMTTNNLDATLTNTSYTKPYFAFNGTNATSSIADNASLEPGTGDFTLEAWVYYSAITGSSRAIISKTDNGGLAANWSYGLRTNSAGATYLEVGNGTTSVTSPSYNVSTGQWYHIVGVWTNVASNSIALYINGVSQGSNSHSFTSVKNSSRPLYIGSYNGGEYSQWFNGRISAVRYYNKALTPQEVEQNFTALRGRFDI